MGKPPKAASTGGGAPPGCAGREGQLSHVCHWGNIRTEAHRRRQSVQRRRFGLGSALKMASFAGKIFMGFGMMRTMRGFEAWDSTR